MSRQKVLDTAKAELGTKENPANSNKNKYGNWYGMDGVMWCVEFVSWVFDHAGHPLGNLQTPKGIHHCQTAHNYYKNRNMLTSNPQPGDIVIFDWTGDGHADHIGIFNQWSDTGKTKFTSYEGNTALHDDSNGGMVMLRNRLRSQVKSFVNPGVFTDTATPVSEDIRKGDRGSDVVKVQSMLKDLGFTIIIDGDFGNGTERVVKEFQAQQMMAVTGIVDDLTLGALEELSSRPRVAASKFISGAYLRKGDKGEMVLLLQRALNVKGANPKITEDGDFGDGTARAVRNFQQSKGLTVDGVAGPQTFEQLGLT